MIEVTDSVPLSTLRVTLYWPEGSRTASTSEIERPVRSTEPLSSAIVSSAPSVTVTGSFSAVTVMSSVVVLPVAAPAPLAITPPTSSVTVTDTAAVPWKSASGV